MNQFLHSASLDPKSSNNLPIKKAPQLPNPIQIFQTRSNQFPTFIERDKIVPLHELDIGIFGISKSFQPHLALQSTPRQSPNFQSC